MARTSVNRHVLESLLLKELKALRGCAGAPKLWSCADFARDHPRRAIGR
jgi:hypothetical protein